MANDPGCADLLASLAEQYEKSRTFLEQLEDSLKQSPALFAAAPGLVGNAVAEQGAPEESDVDEEAPGKQPEQCAEKSNGCSKPSTFRSKLAGLFSRKQTASQSVEEDPQETQEEEMPPKRISIVALGTEFPDRPLPQRAPSGVALQPTSALYRNGPRSPLAVRQHLHATQDGLDPHRLSFSNLGLSVNTSRRRSLESVSRRSLEFNSPARTSSGISLPEIQPQNSRGGSLQHPQRSHVSNAGIAPAATAIATAAAAATATVAPELASPFATPVPPDAAPPSAAGRDIRVRPSSFNRLLAVTTDCAPPSRGSLSPQGQQQPYSPSSPTSSTCTSPLPRTLAAPEASPRVRRRSSFNNGRMPLMASGGGGSGAVLRPNGSSSAVLLPRLIAEDDTEEAAAAAEDGGGDGDCLERSGLVVVGSGHAASAVLSRAASSMSLTGSFNEAQPFAATPMRSRSSRLTTSSVNGSLEGAHRRVSFRQSNGDLQLAATAAVAAVDGDGAKRRDGGLSQANLALSVRDCAPEATFRGTMHLI